LLFISGQPTDVAGEGVLVGEGPRHEFVSLRGRNSGLTSLSTRQVQVSAHCQQSFAVKTGRSSLLLVWPMLRFAARQGGG
jgi:hypothetical protein